MNKDHFAVRCLFLFSITTVGFLMVKSEYLQLDRDITQKQLNKEKDFCMGINLEEKRIERVIGCTNAIDRICQKFQNPQDCVERLIDICTEVE